MSVYTVPLGLAFSDAFASGFWARHAATPPERIARTRVLVNTPRMQRLTEDALLKQVPGSALLPRLDQLPALGADPLSAPDLPPAVDPLRRHLRLIRLVEAYLSAGQGETAPLSAAPALAEALETLLDECDEAGLPIDALEHATGGEHPAHWGRTLAFVDLVRRVWPEIRAEAEGGHLDPQDRQRRVVEAMTAAWEHEPPTEPLIGAGSTGAVASTAVLLAAIARTPGGMVVLPGFDRALPEDVWAEIAAGRAPEHPQAPFAGLLGHLGLKPSEVVPWVEDTHAPARRALFRLALRPAPVTDAWQAAAPALAPEIEAATEGLTLIEAETPRQEAAAIALALREALEEPETRIALITPDAALARRVTAELDRFRIDPDDSLGRPLVQTPPAVFLRLLVEVAGGFGDAVAVLGLLQHPLMLAGLERTAHLELTRAYDVAALRGVGAPLAPGHLPPWPKPRPEDEAAAVLHETGRSWLATMEAALAPLAQALIRPADLATIVGAHIDAAEALSRPPESTPEVWERAAGKAVETAMRDLLARADAHGPDPMPAYRALLRDLLGQSTLRPEPSTPHPRVAILGPREGRGQPAELVVLAGLNDGVWPALPGIDPWLSRPMRKAVGLPEPEQRIGLAAHDFTHAACRARVILSRAKRNEGAPSVASRWLIRLQNLLGGIGDGSAWAGMKARGDAILARLPHIHAPASSMARAPRPMPRPPAEALPRRLSVTEVELLVRDAYALYAKRTLRLRPLDPCGRDLDSRDRGTVFHAILERFIAQTSDALPEPAEARARLLALAEVHLAQAVPAPDLRRIWQARLTRALDWFLEGERARRRQGHPLAVERKGSLVLDAPNGPFTLSAKADRIDLATDGHATIIDYKTGNPPTADQVAAGFNHQLHVQSAILERGGFEGLPPTRAITGAYIGLTGAKSGGKEYRHETLGEETASYLGRLSELIAAYDQGAPFYARGRPLRTDDEGDYDHLARRREWEGIEE